MAIYPVLFVEYSAYFFPDVFGEEGNPFYGYEVFLDQAYAGRTTILEETRDAFALALFSLSLDPNTTSVIDIRAAADRLIEMKGVISDFDSTDYLDGLASGELVAAHAYSSDVAQAREIKSESRLRPAKPRRAALGRQPRGAGRCSSTGECFSIHQFLS